MSKTYDFLKECKTFFVLTIDEFNKPQGRPFGAIFEYNNKLFITTGTTKNVYKQLKNNSHVQLLALKFGTRDWIRVDGVASECFDYEIKNNILKDCPMLLKRFPSADCEYFAVFQIDVINSVLNLDNNITILK